MFVKIGITETAKRAEVREVNEPESPARRGETVWIDTHSFCPGRRSPIGAAPSLIQVGETGLPAAVQTQRGWR